MLLTKKFYEHICKFLRDRPKLSHCIFYVMKNVERMFFITQIKDYFYITVVKPEGMGPGGGGGEAGLLMINFSTSNTIRNFNSLCIIDIS